ncbi:MAG: hypothetical protein AAB768_03420 [Patescibacteria group bacterium]
MKNKLFLIICLILGFFVRTYDFKYRFNYTHDADLAAWVVKDIVVDHHFRLIGQLTSSSGIFIGALYYYLQIPFFWLSGMDPVGTIWLSVGVSLLGIASAWYVLGTYGSLIYAVSWLVANTEREIVPTVPVFLWSIWFYHTLVKLWNGEKKWLYVAVILISLIWHFNLALILGAPLLLLAILKNIKTYSPREIVLPLLLALFLNLPLLVFETRHGFVQTKSLIATVTTVGGKTNKINQTITYVIRNANRVFVPDNLARPAWFLPLVLISLIILFSNKRWLILSWVGLYIVFFSFHPLPLSEYYLNGITIVWIIAASIGLQKLPKILIALILTIFLGINLYRMFIFDTNHAGYIERKALVSYIKEDAARHNYPCVAVSYITSPGNNFGYRYWFWFFRLKAMRPDTLAPVYTIVFPHSYVNRLDKTFGALGLIFPDYPEYTKEGIAKSCDLPDQNLTESMFGFTK